MTAAPIETMYVQSYADNVTLLVQQKESRLERAVTIGNYKGEAASPVEQIGAVAAQKNGGRGQAIRPIEAPTDRPWVYPEDYNLPQHVYGVDKLRMVVDPTSAFNINAAQAMRRAKDDEIVPAFFADRKTGKSGGTTTSFLAANVVPVNTGGATSGMNVAKLRKGKQILMSYDLDEDEELFCAINSIQHDNLLNEVQIISSDFNGSEKPVLVDGKVTRFLGINFIHLERLQVNGSAQRRCPLWAKSGMHLGIWNDIKNDITQRKDIEGLPYQLYTEMTLGATRLEEKKVVEIPCAES